MTKEKKATLQAFADGALETAQQRELEHAVQNSAQLQEEVEMLQQENNWVVTQMLRQDPVQIPPANFADVMARLQTANQTDPAQPETSQPQETTPAPRWRWFQWFGWMGASLATAAVLLLWLQPFSGSQLSHSLNNNRQPGRFRGVPPFVIAKGDSWESIFRFRMLHSFRQPDGSYSISYPTKSGVTLYKGDHIQFTYTAKQPVHVVVGGINDKGEVFPLLTGTKRGKRYSMALAEGSGTLPRQKAFELDQYLGQERYFALLSSSPFPWTKAKDLLHQAWKRNEKSLAPELRLPPSWHIKSFHIYKKERSR